MHPYDSKEFIEGTQWHKKRKSEKTRFYWVLVENGYYPRKWGGEKKWYWLLEGEKILCTRIGDTFYPCRPVGKVYIEELNRGISSIDISLA